jgi:hypothetical protein
VDIAEMDRDIKLTRWTPPAISVSHAMMASSESNAAQIAEGTGQHGGYRARPNAIRFSKRQKKPLVLGTVQRDLSFENPKTSSSSTT